MKKLTLEEQVVIIQRVLNDFTLVPRVDMKKEDEKSIEFGEQKKKEFFEYEDDQD